MMNLLWSRRLLSQARMALLILATQALLPTLAHASPPDPAWIPGIYDDADYDDVVLLVSSEVGSVTPAALDELRPLPRIVGELAHSGESAALTPLASATQSRAPPVR
jgi:hypothetical protein